MRRCLAVALALAACTRSAPTLIPLPPALKAALSTTDLTNPKATMSVCASSQGTSCNNPVLKTTQSVDLTQPIELKFQGLTPGAYTFFVDIYADLPSVSHLHLATLTMTGTVVAGSSNDLGAGSANWSEPTTSDGDIDKDGMSNVDEIVNGSDPTTVWSKVVGSPSANVTTFGGATANAMLASDGTTLTWLGTQAVQAVVLGTGTSSDVATVGRSPVATTGSAPVLAQALIVTASSACPAGGYSQVTVNAGTKTGFVGGAGGCLVDVDFSAQPPAAVLATVVQAGLTTPLAGPWTQLDNTGNDGVLQLLDASGNFYSGQPNPPSGSPAEVSLSGFVEQSGQANVFGDPAGQYCNAAGFGLSANNLTAIGIEDSNSQCPSSCGACSSVCYACYTTCGSSTPCSSCAAVTGCPSQCQDCYDCFNQVQPPPTCTLPLAGYTNVLRATAFLGSDGQGQYSCTMAIIAADSSGARSLLWLSVGSKATPPAAGFYDCAETALYPGTPLALPPSFGTLTAYATQIANVPDAAPNVIPGIIYPLQQSPTFALQLSTHSTASIAIGDDKGQVFAAMMDTTNGLVTDWVQIGPALGGGKAIVGLVVDRSVFAATSDGVFRAP